MRSPAQVKAAHVLKLNLKARAAGVPYLEPVEVRWETQLREAMLDCPEEPRVPVDQLDLERFERWVRTKGWRRMGFGPNGHRNGFNVFLCRIGDSSRVDIPPLPGSWATDVLNGADDDL